MIENATHVCPQYQHNICNYDDVDDMRWSYGAMISYLIYRRVYEACLCI